MAGFVIRALTVALLALYAVIGWAQPTVNQTFRIQAIEVRGEQRLSTGTVLTYLPVTIGDRMTSALAARSIKSLYETGLFENVSLARAGNTLIVKVEERPKISSFKLTGNEAIPSDKLKKVLEKQGMAPGRLFKRSLIDKLTQQLNRFYYGNGYYSVEIDSEVEQLPNNRVAITIDIDEGPVASIRRISIIGNNEFSDERLLEVFTLEAEQSWFGRLVSHPLTFWKSHDQYSRQTLFGDLEALSSFYKDRGYVEFSVTSVQVSVGPDRNDVFVTVNIEEGEQYTVAGTDIAGRTIEPEASLQRLLEVENGEIYSRKEVRQTADNISTELANLGFAFADVKPLTDINEDKKTVNLTFLVKPGARTYVREIGFQGNQKTADQTLRRELRQFEGAPYSRRAVQRSRIRLQRLRFVKSVQINKSRVPDTDQVDLSFNIKERPAGKFQLGVGYSGNAGFLINGSISNSNFLGTGNTVKLSARTTTYQQSVSASWTNPYITRSGISRTVSGFYRRAESLVRDGSDFNLDSYGGAVTYGFPFSEYTSFSLGLGAEVNSIDISDESSVLVKDFVAENGADAFTYSLRAGWQRDTRNRTVFATRGSLVEINLNFKGPGSDLEYYTAGVKGKKYFPIGSWLPVLSDQFVFLVDGRVAYTDIWGQGTDVPPYDNLFAGGPQSIRGFESGGAGPQNEFGDAYGGQFLTTLQTSLVIPTFLPTAGESTRLVLFYDMGAAYKTVDTFDAGKLRKSAGIAFQWFTPFFGLLRLSYAAWVDDQPRDDVKRFQFSFGVGF